VTGAGGEAGRPPRPPVALAPEGTGAWIVRAAWAGAGLQAVAAAAAVATRWGRGPHVVVCSVLLAGGVVASCAAFLRAVNRSRTELVDVAGLFLLIGSVPHRTRRLLWGAVAVSTVVGVAGAAARPYTSLAFGVLAPMGPYGLTVLWNAVHGAFPDRPRRS
jgi:hypothetical protein